jgi:hypothetical protein
VFRLSLWFLFKLITMWMFWISWCNKVILLYAIIRALCYDVQLCNRHVREFLILARTCSAFGLPSKTGCDRSVRSEPWIIKSRSPHNQVIIPHGKSSLAFYHHVSRRAEEDSTCPPVQIFVKNERATTTMQAAIRCKHARFIRFGSNNMSVRPKFCIKIYNKINI